MHLLYLDESGAVFDPNQNHFVLAGFSVFERQSYWLSQQLDDIASRFQPDDPTAVELHGSPILNGQKFWRHHPLPARIQAIKDALEAFASAHESTRAFGAVVSKAAISPRDPVEYCFEQLCSRFDQYLMRLHHNGDTQRGLIIFDEMTSKETSIQSLTNDFRKVGHQWGVVRNLAEVPVFMDSRASRLLQLADLISYGLFRHYEKGDSQFFEIFRHRFDAIGGVTHGLHIVP